MRRRQPNGRSITWVTSLTANKKQAYFGGRANERKPYFGGSVEVLKVQKQLGRGESEGVGKICLLALSLLYQVQKVASTNKYGNEEIWMIPINQKRSYRYCTTVSGRLCVDPDRDHSFTRCCVAGSVSFLASPIQIRHYLYGSGSGKFNHMQKRKKTLIYSVFFVTFYDFLYL